MARNPQEPIQQRAIRTRARIVSAGRTLFSQRGFHGTKVDAIARRARTNKERIYAYFGSKRGLFQAILQDAFAEMHKADKKFLEQTDAADIEYLAESLLHHYMRFHEQHPHFWRLLSWENLEGGKDSAILCNIREASFQKLRALYECAQADGRQAPGVSFEAFILVISSVSFFYFANMQTMSQTLGRDFQDPAVREDLVQGALRLIQSERKGPANND